MIEATNEANMLEKVLEAGEIENGRFLHRFPLEKVGNRITCCIYSL